MTQITCAEFEEVVHGFVRMDLLDVNVREAILEHSAVCANCSQRMAEAIAFVEAAEMVSQTARTEQAPPRVEAALLSAFRERHRRASWRRTLQWAVVGAAAAVLLVFLLPRAVLKQRPVPAQRKDTSSVTGPMDAKTSGISNPVTAAPATTPLSSAGAEISAYAASDFVPVPFAGAVTADDPGMIVRVQLTRASLAQLGYPVAETPGEDLILADVLVGEDGWPRGVKVIQ